MFRMSVMVVAVFLLSSLLTSQESFQQAEQLFRENSYAQALVAYQELLKLPDIRQNERFCELVYHKILCEYYLGNFAQAITSLTEYRAILDDAVGYWRLLGKVYFDAEQFKQAQDAWQEALSLAESAHQKNTIRELLARCYEEQAFQEFLGKRPAQSKILLEKALQTLQEHSEVDSSQPRLVPAGRRMLFLQDKIKNFSACGIPFRQNVPDYSKQQLWQFMEKLLPAQEIQKLKYPWESDAAMQAYVQQHLQGVSGELSKARKLFRMLDSEAFLGSAEVYEPTYYRGRQGFFLGDTAKEFYYVRQSRHSGEEESPWKKYRLGDWEVRNHLFIALARAAGLQAYTVRIFADNAKKWLRPQRIAGIVTQDGNLVLVDLSWYRSFDVLLNDYQVLDDRQAFSYYLLGYNNYLKEAEPLLTAALGLYPTNEAALLTLAQRALNKFNISEARPFLEKLPPTARNWSLYWETLYDMRMLIDDSKGAWKVLKAADLYIQESPGLYKRQGLLEYKMGNLEKSLQHFRASVALSPLYQQAIWRMIGLLEEEKENYPAALQAYESSLEFSSSNADVYKAYEASGDVHLKLDQPEAAIKCYLQALKAGGEYVEPLFNIATVYREGKNYEKANAIYDQLLRFGPDSRHLMRRFLENYRSQDKLDEAFNILHAFINNHAQQNTLWHKLGNACAELKINAPAKEYYTKALDAYINAPQADVAAILDVYYGRGLVYYSEGSLEQALLDFNHAVELSPQTPHPYLGRGNVRYRKGDLDGAFADFNMAIQLDPKSSFAYNNRAMVFQTKGDTEGAEKDYAKAIQLDPKYLNAYLGRGDLRYRRRQVDGAILDYTRAIELDAENPSIYFSRGNVYYDKRDWEAAIADYSKVIELDPKSHMAYNNRGISRKAKGDLEGAIADYTKAIEMIPNYTNAFINRAKAYREKNAWDKAILDYEKALSMEPKYWYLYNALAETWGQSKDYKQAIAVLQRGLETHQNHTSLLWNLGWYYYLDKNYDKTIEVGEKAFAIAPKITGPVYNMALAYLAKDDAGSAEKWYTRAMEQDKTKESLKASRDDIENLYKERPDLNIALYFLGLHYACLGDKAKAGHCYRQYGAKAQNQLWKDKAAARLKELGETNQEGK